ncbi:RNA metabolism protein [Lithospermum erythrorhizon]|uniref:RNA metabolism protein n=1 Tax=Lithospermum erythrorhizon TaxID=34254 RepID=A0AAV3REY8_LITER
MESENSFKLPPSCGSPSENENDGVHDSGCAHLLGGSPHENPVVREDEVNGRTHESISEIEVVDEPPFDEDMDMTPPRLQFPVELSETVSVTEIVSLSSEGKAENGFSTANGSNRLGIGKEDILFESTREINAPVLSGTKRPRTTSSDQRPSVRVIYNSIARESRQKLEELLKQWSEWHARHCSSTNDSNEVLESGEEMYFPALDVGSGKGFTVPFWIDNQLRNPLSKEIIPLDGTSIPLYDRGFSLALRSDDGTINLESNLDVLNTSRCFNCGSYNHSLRECPKPRDNIAVNNARQQQKSRRSQNISSRNPTRYYQSSPHGKFDGLRPGVLDSETRKLLGLGELDPPPWLTRMREIGYPPGYLDLEDLNQPSGITIFADEEKIQRETEEGEILEVGYPEPPKKMSPETPRKTNVEFPGVNAPIPENADRRRWEAGSSSSNFSRSHSHRRYDLSADSFSRGHYYGSDDRHGDYQDDAPPGTDSRSSSYRYGSYGSSYPSYSPTSNYSGRRSLNNGRSLSSRSRRSPIEHVGQ